MTLYLCFGKYAGFKFERKGKVIARVVLGCISLALVSYDVEVLVDKCLDKVDQLKDRIILAERQMGTAYGIPTNGESLAEAKQHHLKKYRDEYPTALIHQIKNKEA